MSIEFETQGMEEAKVLLSNYPKRLRIATAHAVNRTIGHIKKEISKTVRKEYLVRAKEIKKTLNVRRASRSRLTGEISSVGRPIPLDAFNINISTKLKPLTVKVRKTSKRRPVRGLFLGTSRNGYTGLMQRVHKGKAYPLRIPYGPSAPQMIDNEQVIAEIEREAEEYLNKRFREEVEHQLNK